MIVICDRFCSPEVVINGSCGSYESFLVWGKPFPDCGGGREGGLWTVFKVDGSPTRLAFRGCFCGFCGPGGVLFGLWIALSSLWGGGGSTVSSTRTCTLTSEAALAAFAVLRGLLMVSVGAMRPIWSGNGPFWTVGVGKGGEFVGCVQVEKSVRARVTFRC